MSAAAARIARLSLVTIAGITSVWLALAALFAAPAGPPPRYVLAETDRLEEDLVVMGQTVEVSGHARGSVVVFGGDVNVSGSVDGDVATIGGSVVQAAGSHISGDILVVGGRYEHGGCVEPRGAGTETVVYQGNEQSLREFFNNPARELLAPRIDRYFIGRRLAAALFSFLLTLAIVAVAPGPVGRASERLLSGSLNIAVIGLIGTVVMLLLAGLALVLLPAPAAALILGVLLIALLAVQVFGRVVTYFLVGRWLQRHAFGERSRSQAVALLLGVLVLAFLGSLPVVGALLLFAVFILSVGIVLTSPALLRARE
jgi:hypothetical protein